MVVFSTSLKNLLETLLAVGNYLNGATEMGQADGYGLDVLNKLKEIQDRVCYFLFSKYLHHIKKHRYFVSFSCI